MWQKLLSYYRPVYPFLFRNSATRFARSLVLSIQYVFTMVMCIRFCSRYPGPLYKNTIAVALTTKRSLVTITHHYRCSFRKIPSAAPYRSKRTFVNSVRDAITGQEAPSAQAYISSGILGGRKNLEDVKKVLVIGSGGLSIGQAGEFDYSGEIRYSFSDRGGNRIAQLPLL